MYSKGFTEVQPSGELCYEGFTSITVQMRLCPRGNGASWSGNQRPFGGRVHQTSLSVFRYSPLQFIGYVPLRCHLTTLPKGMPARWMQTIHHPITEETTRNRASVSVQHHWASLNKDACQRTCVQRESSGQLRVGH